MSADSELKISVLGDSYSTFEGFIPAGNAIYYNCKPNCKNGVTSVEHTWWHRVIQALGGRLERNESYSGSTVCNTGYGKTDATATSFITRMKNLGNPDLILICGGTNDCWAGVPMGDFVYENWSADELFSFRPAMAEMLSGLQNAYPAAKIFFVLNSELSDAVNDSVHTVCAHYQTPCIDLREISKINGHPDYDGMAAMAEQVSGEVKKYL